MNASRSERDRSVSRPEVDLALTASAAVEAFRSGANSGDLPEEADGWNEAFVRAILDLKERFRGSPDLGRLLKIASEQLYGKDVHWALELLQNAEDAGARHIVFVFERDRVLVSNDGAAFDAEDVWAICSAGHSAKKNKIGFFGIGFKSVFKISDAPEIRSGHYALRLQDKIYPSPLDVDSPVRPRGARFTLPVRPAERDRIGNMLRDLTSAEFLHLLLTLELLETIGGGEVRRGARTAYRKALPSLPTCTASCRSMSPLSCVGWSRPTLIPLPAGSDSARTLGIGG